MANIVKNTTGTDLTLGPSWLGGTAPTSADVAVWVSGSLGGSLTLPASRSWQGINVSAAPTSAISVTGAGTLTVGVNGVVVDTTALNVTWATPVLLGANQPWTVGSGRQLTFSGVVSGTSRTLTLSGAGTTYLQGTNTYSGTTNISAGLVLAENSGFGTSAVSMTGGTVSSPDANPRSYANAFTFNGTVGLSFSASNGVLTFSGTTTIAGTTTLTVNSAVILSGALSGSVGFTKTGTAPLYLNGVSGYLGTATISGSSSVVVGADGGASGFWRSAVTINSGASLVANNYNMFGYSTNASAPSVTINTGGTLTNFVNPYLTTIGPLTLAGGTLTSGAQQVVPGVISGAYILRGGVTATDNSTISGFPVAIGSDTSPTGVVNVSSGKTLTISANLVNTPNTAFTAAQTTNLTQQTGTGTLTLSGTNTFTGTVSISAGTLNANSATALGAASSTAAITVTSGATLSLGAATSYTSRTTTISGTGVSTGGALVHNYAGTANVGSISIGANGSYIRGTETGTLSSSISAAALTWTVGASAGKTFTLSGTLSGSSQITVGNASGDTGAVIFTASNAGMTGAISVAYGTLRAQNANALGSNSGSVTVASGAAVSVEAALAYTSRNFSIAGYGANFDGALILNYAASAVQIGNVLVNADSYVRSTVTGTLSSAGFAINPTYTLVLGSAAGCTLTLSGTITGSGNVEFGYLSPDSGTISLTSATPAGTFTGTRSLYYGTVSFVYDAIGAITLYGGVLKWSAGNAQDISSGIGLINDTTATLDIGANNVPFSHSFANVNQRASLVLTGSTGTATFSAANTFTGSVAVNGATLSITNASALGANRATTLAVASGATLSIGALSSLGLSSFTTTLSGSGASGAGALILGSAYLNEIDLGSISLGAATTIKSTDGGTLKSNINTTASNYALTLLAINAKSIVLLGAISGGGALQAGDGTNAGAVRLYANNTYTGATVVSAGTTLELYNYLGSGAIYNNTISIGASGNVLYYDLASVPAVQRFNGIVSGSGNLSVQAGYLRLTANNTLSGSFLVYGGELRLYGTNTNLSSASVTGGYLIAGNTQALGTTGTVTLGVSGTLQTLTTGGQNGKLTVAGLTNTAGGTIKIGG